jgi:hypothetical protein
MVLQYYFLLNRDSNKLVKHSLLINFNSFSINFQIFSNFNKLYQ